jgi:hypothetical protein
MVDGAPQTGFRVPGGKVGLWINAVVPTLAWILLLVFTAREHWMLATAVLACGPLFYALERLLRGSRPRSSKRSEGNQA